MKIKMQDGKARSDAVASAPAPVAAPFLFAVQVWGQPYTQIFIDILLPCAATPGNFGSFDRSSEFRIYTTAADAATITASPVYQKIASIVTTRIELIDESYGTAPHDIMSECQRRAGRDATLQKMAVVFLAPDTAISDSMFSRIRELWLAGYRAVMLTSVRASLQTFVPAVLPLVAPDGTLHLSSRKLIQLMMENLHPISKCLFWDSPTFTVHPSHIYWRVGKHGLLGMCAHIHPIMVDAVAADMTFESTIDGDYVPNAVPDPALVYVVTDSDEMVIVEISSDSQLLHPIVPAKPDVREIARWAEWCTNAFHRRNMLLTFRLHAGDIDRKWKAAETARDAVRNDVLKLLARDELTIALVDRPSLKARLSRFLLRPKDFAVQLPSDIGQQTPAAIDAQPVPASVAPLVSDVASLVEAPRQKEKLFTTSRVRYFNLRWLSQLYLLSIRAREIARKLVDKAFQNFIHRKRGPTILHHAWTEYRQVREIIEKLLDRPQSNVLIAGCRQLPVAKLPVVSQREHRITRISSMEDSAADAIITGTDKWSYADASFDVVICFNFLEQSQSPEMAIAEMKRVLKDGGSLLVFGSFMKYHDYTPQDRWRFTHERLLEIVEPQTEITQVGVIGGIGSLIASIVLVWPFAALRSSRLTRFLRPLFILAYIPVALLINMLAFGFNLVDRSRTFYSYSYAGGRRTRRSEV